MNLKKARSVLNKALAPLNIEMTRLNGDLDARIVSGAHVHATTVRLAEQMEAVMRRDVVFPDRASDLELLPFINSFYQSYESVAKCSGGGGSRFLNLLWLAVLARAVKPDLIIDSGTFKGLSAWALRFGAPEAELHSFDIDLGNLCTRVDANYHESDWTTVPLDTSGRRTLCYFDDHVDQVRRVLEAAAAGHRWLIFDDDVGVSRVPAIAATSSPLPKLQFLTDTSLVHGEELVWETRGRQARFRIDQTYLQRARDCIAQMQKVPDLWQLVPTVHQNPYTLVVLH